jgi:hypothetical protein
MQEWKEWLIILAVLFGWIILNRYVLPKMGVET